MNQSIFYHLNQAIRIFKFVKDYQDREPRQPSTTDHEATGLVLCLLIELAATAWGPLVWLIPLVWFYYAPFTEIVLDTWVRHKNKTYKDAFAQIMERSIGWVAGFPFVFFAT